MTVRHNKSAIVAALLVLAAALVDGSGRARQAANAIPDLPAALDQARVIHVKGRQYFPGQKQENGQPIPPVEIGHLDRQADRPHTPNPNQHVPTLANELGERLHHEHHGHGDGNHL